ncbi:MAG: bifunctional isocitrate dehydrogenase kinase/phosphatase [Saprospiraceae bacterium]|nr:bifunctional isocitrate dehydrogenase kinase/phosphatase [Saprospiraceae bacterium]
MKRDRDTTAIFVSMSEENAVQSPNFDKLIPYDAAHLILGEYFNYYHQFKSITRRAEIRFEACDWHGLMSDARERITLYRDCVGGATEKVLILLGERAQDREVWKATFKNFSFDIKNFNTRNIAETFYNSVFRHSHQGLGADEDLMFVHATATYREFKSTEPIYHSFKSKSNLRTLLRYIAEEYSMDVPWKNLDRNLDLLEGQFIEELEERNLLGKEFRVEMLKSVFYRNKGAYIVGRLLGPKSVHPLVLPLLNGPGGIVIDALLMDDRDVSSIFSYNRSYFLVDVDIASEIVDFLHSILPTKPLSELYNSIGFEKHGKTVFYRNLLRHLAATDEKMIIAPGIKGMVMSVFTLPSFGMVFKVIKDRFAPPKDSTQEQVKEKYKIVNLHHRVGRMVDSHVFENLDLESHQLSDAVREEMQEFAPSKLLESEGKSCFTHLYVEKRMIPLNIYLEGANLTEAEEVIDEYGKAIKQMAAVNIFPGDMLLKNFGVTRLKRVVFYDYDEIGFLTDYNFRRIPEPRDEFEEMSSEPYYHVGPMDIFPEEFPRFLIGDPQIRAIFHRLHGDLYDVAFWRGMQKKLINGEIIDVFPYRDSRRLSM